jgi:hypothetical protein
MPRNGVHHLGSPAEGMYLGSTTQYCVSTYGTYLYPVCKGMFQYNNGPVPKYIL